MKKKFGDTMRFMAYKIILPAEDLKINEECEKKLEESDKKLDDLLETQTQFSKTIPHG